jgi:hypothetical protein
LIVGGDVVRLSAVGALARRRWRLLAVSALVGGLLGFGLSFVLSPGYSASSKVLLHGQPDKNQLATEAQIAMSLNVLDRVAADLQWGLSGIDLRSAVTVSVLDGNVLQVVGLGSTPERARALTDRATAQYIVESTKIGGDTAQAVEAAKAERRKVAQKRVDDLRAQLEKAQSTTATPEEAASVSQLTSAVAAAQADVTEMDRQDAQRTAGSPGSTTVSVLEPALDGGAASPTRVQLTAGGAAAAALVGLYGMLWARRRRGPLADPDEIAGALGAPVLASVVVAQDPIDGGDRHVDRSNDSSYLGRLLALLSDDEEDAAPVIEPHAAGETTRYRRALARLGGSVRGRFDLLVIVLADDGAAFAAVAEFAASAAAVRGPVTIVADGLPNAEHYRRLVGTDRRVRVTNERGEVRTARTVFLVTAVPVARPTVPEPGHVSGVLVILRAGTRTQDELADLAGACFDAGAPITGAVVVAVGRPLPTRAPAGSAGRWKSGRPATDAVTTGSS